MLTISYLAATSHTTEKDTEAFVLDSQSSQLQNYLSGNASQVSNLTAQVKNLSDEVLQLKSAIAQKNSENEKLNQQVIDLRKSLNKILGELDALDRTEQIYNLIQSLNNPPPELTDTP